MTNGWAGADPNQVDEPGSDYELATRFTANADITISAIRVWATASVNINNRNAYIWTTAGVVQRTIDIDDTLPTSGWSTYNLATPLDIADGASFDVSYSARQYYGAVAGGYPAASSDGDVTAIAGRFEATIGLFPTNATNSFYGIDIVYALTGGNQPPEITGLQLQSAGTDVIGTVTLTDETPATVSLSWDWGDGYVIGTGPGVLTSSHTYDESGLYAVMVTATDAQGLQDSYAVAVQITIAGTTDASEDWFTDLLDAVVSDVQRSGYFDKVNTHEPKKAPGTGLTAAVWLQSIEPIALASGLAATSARIIFTLRVYQSMLMEPQDLIDPSMARAVANLMRRYHDDFDFEGLIRNVDLLGSFGVSLSAVSGYLEIDGSMYRIMDMTIPCIVNDVWPQVN